MNFLTIHRSSFVASCRRRRPKRGMLRSNRRRNALSPLFPNHKTSLVTDIWPDRHRVWPDSRPRRKPSLAPVGYPATAASAAGEEDIDEKDFRRFLLSTKTCKCKLMPVDVARFQKHTWFTHHPPNKFARSSIFGKHDSKNHLLPTVSTANSFGGCAATRITKVRYRPIKARGVSLHGGIDLHDGPRPSRTSTTLLARAGRRRNGIGNAWHNVVERWPGHDDVVGGRQDHDDVFGRRQGHDDDVFAGRQGHDDNVERRARAFIWWCRTAAKTWRWTARPWR
jgi:hypothetical protein